jgi:hypothetical protein
MLAYQAAAAAIPKPVEIGEKRTQPGTSDSLVASYCNTTEWNALDPETQKTRRSTIEKFRAAPGD